jgi:hypothetical protein
VLKVAESKEDKKKQEQKRKVPEVGVFDLF